jgi:hypothetical protein
MEMEFQIITELRRNNLVKVNRQELKRIVRILMILAGAAIALSVFNLALQALYGKVLQQDIQNLIISILIFILVHFLPVLLSYIQIPAFRLRHLDGERKILICDDGIEIQSERYDGKKYDFSSITQIYDRYTYYKVMIGTRPLYIHKEDFVVGSPEDFFKYVKSKLE